MNFAVTICKVLTTLSDLSSQKTGLLSNSTFLCYKSIVFKVFFFIL